MSKARLIGITELAELLGVSGRQVYRLMNDGLMPPPVRLGGSLRWDRLAVDQWIQSGCPKTSSPQASKGGDQ
ncbi:Prophage CP4-57 regulatory protein (AlpA) [Pirellula sp. SH-Sr6A]|uniref:helix-turn-helix transcriptional regulator n=1 Tax=Pirellula sp. SH-Sr6A TaxID=1632865 RepID=UPI00078E273E|nr:helix-turn-helix domain-containing protein [Pirellula sp. SH-Sr6A]AMV32559.1 Prophage CP4-57 regulatory protein (AlpA) [Pirellula sp. SH-Sr6A]